MQFISFELKFYFSLSFIYIINIILLTLNYSGEKICFCYVKASQVMIKPI